MIVFGKWRGDRKGQLTLEGLAGDGKFRKTFDVAKAPASKDNAALRYLWARSRIARLDDYQHLERRPGPRPGDHRPRLEVSPADQYTSFLAVDQVVRNPRPADADRQAAAADAARRERSRRRRIVPTSPEPELIALVGIAGAMAAWARRRKASSVRAESV